MPLPNYFILSLDIFLEYLLSFSALKSAKFLQGENEANTHANMQGNAASMLHF